MIISEGYAKRLIRDGKASRLGWVAKDRGLGLYFAIVTRFDVQRTDHYPLRSESKEYAAMLGARG